MNFLVVIADQMSPAALPPYGNRVVRAPHISHLAESGVVFEHAYCSSPLCAPSRASFMSSLLPSRIGVYDNGAEFAASIPTLVHRLRSLDYRTWLAGKMHFIGPDQLHGFETRLTPDIYPAGMHWIPDWSRPLGDPLPWYHDMSSVFDAGVAEATLQIDYDDEVGFRSVRAIYDLARAGDDRPFLFVASFSQPHDPWEVREEHWHRYDGIEIDPPEVPFIADDRLDPHGRRIREMCGGVGLRVADDVVQNARRAHYASISYVDDRVGELMEALDATGLRDETTVIFMADHGESLGERGLWYKMTFFEPSVAVPFIVSAPRHFKAARVTSIVSLLDLGPTLVDLAGGPTDKSLDGSSMVPLLRGGGDDRTIVSEYLAEGAIAPAVMVRKGALKRIVSGPDPDQLYDLDEDPHELTNLAPTNAAL
ncbi:MAG TPA: choline-sulfatase, partial [Candidatus Dormibacteraeota bacterium]|nr:choline-sulfatase [Candidatus Dormibacteraeota bacterium]